MSRIPSRQHPDCPPAYGGCRCHCHSMSGVKHVTPCCRPQEALTTFDELSAGCTPEEREALVWRLAEIRYRNTLRALLPQLTRSAPPQEAGQDK